MKKTNKRIVSSVASIALCASLVAGGSYALFTSESEVNVAVTSGTVKVVASVNEGSLKTYSMGEAQTAGKFENGGMAGFNEYSQLELSLMTPGDKAEFTVDIANESNVAIQYRVSFGVTGGLAEVLDCSATNADNTWVYAEAKAEIPSVAVTVELPESVGDTYQSITDTVVTVKVEAVQGNTPMVDKWDGTADVSWYNDTDTEFELSTAEQLAGLAALVDNSPVARNANFANAVTFDGKTLKLTSDVDLEAYDENGNRVPFNPIGHSSNGQAFKGTFDGQGHTISNLYEQSNLDSNNGGWLYEGEYYGLFAYTDGAEIKNVTVDGAYISSGRNEAAGVVGNAVDTDFSNITISNTTLIAYNNSAGGVAAECYGECSFTNITVDENTVLGPLWGTYDVRLGGVVGMVKSSDKVTFSNITVACKIDAINDVAANYQYWLYRYSGMLIGQVDGVNGVADPTGYVTCENVTVIYDDWMNYHYCEFASLGAGSYNGPGEYKYARVEAGTGTDGIDLSECNHNADESHNVLIVFDQLFGGGQGVKGLKAYDGVTVNYPASYNPEN